jgi:GTPase
MQRRARKRSNLMAVSLVGYTNAGKSTLFNRLTRSEIYAADQLFATLDTTSRKMHLPELEGYGSVPVVLSDTVGFIKHLPTTLIEAFGATLEEAAQADLLLHVVDMASTNREAQITQVNRVLQDIGADKVPQVLILNQIDRMDCEAGFDRDEYGKIARIRVSAKTGEGMDYIRLALQEHHAYLKKLSTEKTAYA